MFDTIYMEDALTEHPRVTRLLDRFPKATRVFCNRYTEIFNRKSQSFRLQKQKPALILAKKFSNFVLPTPPGYGIGSENNYYFSHMLNCIYDCRYCFLQGMYRSAHYVLFVNYEDFLSAIKTKIDSANGDMIHFFSGYDCDSLAFEPVSHFAELFLPLFRDNPAALVELRTKSTQIRTLLDMEPLPNCVIAFSFTPADVAATLEHRVPSVQRRIEAMKKLQMQGWQLGLRFDPLVYHSDFRKSYDSLFESVFSTLDQDILHSVSLGSFRLPARFFQTLSDMYPDERLFASPLAETDGMISYKHKLQQEMTEHCRDRLLKYVPVEKLFFCEA